MINYSAGSVAVMGGADGPTAIFVASNMTMPTLVTICVAVGLVVGIIAGVLYKRAKNKKDDNNL